MLLYKSSRQIFQPSKMNAFPTGNELVDLNILLQLTDQDLANVCRSNVYASQLCRDNYFWRLKLEQGYPHFLHLRDDFPSYRALYQWAKIQTYVLFEGSHIVYNNIHDAYKYMVSGLYSVPEKQIPPINQAPKLLELAKRLGTTQPTYLYALPYGEQIVGRDPNHILLKLPDYLDPEGFVSPLLGAMPILEPDIFLTYHLYLSGNQRETRVSKFTPQHMEEVYQYTQIPYEIYPTKPGNRSLLIGQFSIQRSDTQGVRQFVARGNFFLSEGFVNLVIIRDITGNFLLAELPVGLRGVYVLTQKIIDDLQWKPLDDIRDYLV